MFLDVLEYIMLKLFPMIPGVLLLQHSRPEFFPSSPGRSFLGQQENVKLLKDRSLPKFCEKNRPPAALDAVKKILPASPTSSTGRCRISRS